MSYYIRDKVSVERQNHSKYTSHIYVLYSSFAGMLRSELC